MLTRAAEQAIQTFAIWNYRTDSYSAVPMFPNDSVFNTAGNERWISYTNGRLIESLSIATTNLVNAGFHFGNGTTAPTKYDYALESQITSGLSAVLASSKRGVDVNNYPYMNFVFTCTNSGNSDITISEIGLYTGTIYCCTSSTATSAAWNNFMLDRTLLDTPVTIAPNDTAAIKYTIKCFMSFA